jgi:hypothetical protein
MDYLANVGKELKGFFENNSFFKSIFSLDAVLICIGLGVMIMDDLFDFKVGTFHIGNILQPIAYWMTIIGFLFAFAKNNLTLLMIGLFVLAADDLVYLVYYIVRDGYFGFGSLLYGVVYGTLGYFTLKRNQKPKPVAS